MDQNVDDIVQMCSIHQHIEETQVLHNYLFRSGNYFLNCEFDLLKSQFRIFEQNWTILKIFQ